MASIDTSNRKNCGSYLERQRTLLEKMLAATLEQRRSLIEGDVRGLERTSATLQSLIASQEQLRGEGPEPCEEASHRVIWDLRRLAEELQRETRANYVLVCRGTAFAQRLRPMPVSEAASSES